MRRLFIPLHSIPKSKMDGTTVKTIAVCAIIFGCFAVLYPRIFHPMLMHMFGEGESSQRADDVLSHMPPHLRRGGGGVSGRGGAGHDDISKHLKPGPHPGLRAAAEMRKQATTTQGGGGKGMMGVVLPMYAVGIVVYLIYTLSKVFGRKEKKGDDYLTNHFSGVRYDGDKKKFVCGEGEGVEEDDFLGYSARKRKQRDLERLLLKADKENINQSEMTELKRRLLETESQMTKILQAMEAAQQKVTNTAERMGVKNEDWPEDETVEDYQQEYEYQEDFPEQEEEPFGARGVDSSPDTESYEFVNRDSQEERAERPAYRDSSSDDDQIPEELGPEDMREDQLEVAEDAESNEDFDDDDTEERPAQDESDALMEEGQADVEYRAEDVDELNEEEQGDVEEMAVDGDVLIEEKQDSSDESYPDLRQRKMNQEENQE